MQRKGKQLRQEGSNALDTPLIQQLLGNNGQTPSRYPRTQSLPSYASPAFTDILDIPTRHFAQQITAMDNVSIFTDFALVGLLNFAFLSVNYAKFEKRTIGKIVRKIWTVFYKTTFLVDVSLILNCLDGNHLILRS